MNTAAERSFLSLHESGVPNDDGAINSAMVDGRALEPKLQHVCNGRVKCLRCLLFAAGAGTDLNTKPRIFDTSLR